MLRILLVCSATLIAQDPAPPPSDPAKAAPKAEADAAEARSLAKYNELRDRTPDTAAGHWKMALWCEENKLRPEAYVHLARVVELDPKRDLAWRKLGLKKHDGRWMTDAQIASEAEQKKAEAAWLPQLKKWHREIHGGRKQAEAEAALLQITDPAAVPAIYREFGSGSPKDQEIAVGLFGQVDAPLASKVLAVMAVYGKTSTVRRLATEILRGRKSEDYLDILVALMKDPLRFEVRPVGGPGSPGVLLVEGERFNVRRFYAPPAVNFNPRPGDTIGYDANGLPVVSRSESFTIRGQPTGVKGSKTLVTENDATITATENFSFANAMVEAQKGAMVAQAQLQGDIRRVEAVNDQRKRFTDLVAGVARDATGKNPGPTAKAWRDSLSGPEDRYAKRPRKDDRRTVDELIPLAYVPDLTPTASVNSSTSFLTRTYADS